MSQNIETIQFFAKSLISVDSSVPIKAVYSLMIAEKVSHLPIIDHDFKKNVGVYRRKDLFEWILKNPDKNIDDQPQALFKKDPLSEVGSKSDLSETMNKLRGKSGILLKDGGKYTHFISPRVVANALEKYSEHYMTLEKLEHLIRKRIRDKKIKLSDISLAHIAAKSFPTDPEHMTFGHYRIVFGKKWKELDINLDKKVLDKYLENVNEYRNALLHFRFTDKSKGLDQAQKIINILE